MDDRKNFGVTNFIKGVRSEGGSNGPMLFFLLGYKGKELHFGGQPLTTFSDCSVNHFLSHKSRSLYGLYHCRYKEKISLQSLWFRNRSGSKVNIHIFTYKITVILRRSIALKFKAMHGVNNL